MPCDSGPPDHSKMYEQLNQVTQLLCEVGHLFEMHGRIEEMSSEFRVWWHEHQMKDRERESREEAQGRREALRRQALSRLTKEEKEVLGVRSEPKAFNPRNPNA